MTFLHHDAKLDRLKAIPLFANATSAGLEHLLMAADEISVPPDSVLIHQGHAHHEGYVIVSGTVGIAVNGEQVAEIGEGEIVGELGLFGQRPASATVTALTTLNALVIPYNRFDQILDDNPSMAKTMAIKLAARLHGMDVRRGTNSNG